MAGELLADLKRLEREAGAQGRTERPPIQMWPYAVAAVAGLAILAAGGLIWHRGQPKPLTGQDVLVLADFTNSTGDPVFDGTLRQSLAIELERSPFLKIISDEEMRQDLRLIWRSTKEPITNEIANEECGRESEKATIGGSIASLGKSYAITLQATNCQTGQVLALEQVEAEDKEHVLKAMAVAGAGIRAKLGNPRLPFGSSIAS